MTRLFGRDVRHNVAKVGAVRFLYWLHFISAVLVPFYREWGRLSFTEILLLNAWLMFWTFALEVPTGTIADRYGRRFSMILACPVAAAGAVVYVSHPSMPVFLVAEFLFGVSLALMSGADEALVYDSLVSVGAEERSKQIYGRLDSCKLAGILCGAVAGGFVAKHFGVTAPMQVQAIPLLLAGLVALTLVEPRGDNDGAEPQSYARLLSGGLRYFLGHRVLRLLAVDMVLVGALAWLIIWLYQPLLEAAGIDIMYFGLVHAGMTVGQIALLANFNRVETLLRSRRLLLVLGTVVPGLCYLGLAYTDNPWAVIPLILAASHLGLTRLALFTSYMNKHIPSELRATALSTASMFRTLAIAVVNPISGLLVDWSLRGAMAVLGAVMLLLAVMSPVRSHHLID